jgi:cysteine desulfurase/selenocysteine lyase
MGTLDVQRLRADFPPLARRRNGKPPIYLNNTCMTLRPKPVIEAIARYYEEFPTCGGGRAEGAKHLHNWFMEELKLVEEGSRGEVARLLHAASHDEIVWTRNTSEALNIVACGLPLEPGDEILTSEREHNSNLVPWLEAERRLRERAGDPRLVVKRVFDLAPDGSFSLANALAAITPRTKVVAIGQSSNLDGTTIPNDAIQAIAKKVHANKGWLVIDAAQSVPHVPVDVQSLGCDFLAFSLHKMCGPSGMGALYGRKSELQRLKPFIVGGDTIADTWQDRVVYKDAPGRFEAGLQDYAGMIGAAEAIRYVRDTVGMAAIHEHEVTLDPRAARSGAARRRVHDVVVVGRDLERHRAPRRRAPQRHAAQGHVLRERVPAPTLRRDGQREEQPARGRLPLQHGSGVRGVVYRRRGGREEPPRLHG